MDKFVENSSSNYIWIQLCLRQMMVPGNSPVPFILLGVRPKLKYLSNYDDYSLPFSSWWNALNFLWLYETPSFQSGVRPKVKYRSFNKNADLKNYIKLILEKSCHLAVKNCSINNPFITYYSRKIKSRFVQRILF